MDGNRLQQLWFRGGPLQFNMGLLTHVVSGVAAIMGLLMLVPMWLSLRQDDGAWWVFAIPAIPLVAIAAPAFVLSRVPTETMPLVRPRDVYLSVTGAWVAAAIIGTFPLILNQNFGTVPEALFESMSAITTTGATAFQNVDDLRDSIKLWRSLMQWLGGIGIVVLFVGVAPAVGAGAMRVFFAEIGGPAKERLTPRISQTAKLLARVYVTLTLVCCCAYLVAGMTPFEAVNHAMTTISTGGMSTRTASIAGFESTAIELVAMTFMFLGAVNFAIYWSIARKGRIGSLQLAELLSFAAAAAAFSIIVAASLVLSADVASIGTALLDGAFAVVSVVTTTGYTTADWDQWNEFARSVILFVMFVGGCAGSTAGGIKIIRWMLLGAQLRQETNKLLHPSAVTSIRIGGRSFPESVRSGLLVFLTFYMITFAVAAAALTIMGVPLESAIAASSATLNMVGPGIGEIGASESYQAIPQAGLLLLSFNMLLGRLEIFTVLVLLLPGFWRRR